MNRRLFFKTMGLSSIGIASAGYLMANNNFLMQNKVVQFPPEELKSALTQHINRYFNGELFNPNEPLPNGIILVADGFEVEPVVGKNTIFDFADQVIEQCQKIGFDASSLKNGQIPKGMEVGKSSYRIRTSEIMCGNKIEGFKDYDVLVKYHNGFLINSKLPPIQWNTVRKLKTRISGEHGAIYVDAKEKLDIRMSTHQHKDYVSIQSLKPNLIITPGQRLRMPISRDLITPFLNEETQKLIFNKSLKPERCL
jgi:hypothetical protein